MDEPIYMLNKLNDEVVFCFPFFFCTFANSIVRLLITWSFVQLNAPTIPPNTTAFNNSVVITNYCNDIPYTSTTVQPTRSISYWSTIHNPRLSHAHQHCELLTRSMSIKEIFYTISHSPPRPFLPSPQLSYFYPQSNLPIIACHVPAMYLILLSHPHP